MSQIKEAKEPSEIDEYRIEDEDALRCELSQDEQDFIIEVLSKSVINILDPNAVRITMMARSIQEIFTESRVEKESVVELERIGEQ